jgi:hypothetical protein
MLIIRSLSPSGAVPEQRPTDFSPVSAYDAIPLQAQIRSRPPADLVAALRAVDRTRIGADLLSAVNALQSSRGVSLRIVQKTSVPGATEIQNQCVLGEDGAPEWHMDLRSLGSLFEEADPERNDRRAMAVFSDLRKIAGLMMDSEILPSTACRWAPGEFRRQMGGVVENPFVPAPGTGARARASSVHGRQYSFTAETVNPADSARRDIHFARLTWLKGTSQARDFEKALKTIAATPVGERLRRKFDTGVVTPTHVRFADASMGTSLLSRLAIASGRSVEWDVGIDNSWYDEIGLDAEALRVMGVFCVLAKLLRIESRSSCQDEDESIQQFRAQFGGPISGAENHLRSWIGQALDGERRVEAARTIRTEWRSPTGHLRLSGMGLRSVPAMLPDVERLDVSVNRLEELPADLPVNLISLNASDNRLTQLRALPDGLLFLDVHGNLLRELPSILPRGLTIIDASNNGLSRLPVLPGSLQEMKVSDNVLTALPGTLPHSLMRLDVTNNRLTSLSGLPSQLRTLHASNNPVIARPDDLPPYLEPVDWGDILYESLMSVIEPFHAEQELAFWPLTRLSFTEEIGRWRGGHESRANWKLIAAENPEGVENFSRFLASLRGNQKSFIAMFGGEVRTIIEMLEKPPRADLRRQCFGIAEDALSSCGDRTLLALNDMTALRLTCAVEAGDFDDRLDELLRLARGMWRLGKLQAVARQTFDAQVKQIERQRRGEYLGDEVFEPDQVEIFLAYQVKLGKLLDLPIAVDGMLFPSLSQVSTQNLDDAKNQIEAAEQKEFLPVNAG